MLQFDVIRDAAPFILEGVGVTLKFTAVSLLCGLPLGLLLAFLKIHRCKYLRSLAAIYTSVFRGTPLLVQLSLIFFGLPALTGYNMSPFLAGVLTFSLNSAAYTSEVIRSGLQSIDIGQWEAGKVLGLSRTQTLRHIIFPQAFRVSLPSLVNEWIDLLKESALVSVIGEADLFRRAQIIAAEKYLYFEPYLTVALCYYIMILVLTFLATQLERKMRYA
ncbi:MAG: amino acid ABC transporter permease [Alphaproteobacteria bacterium]|nr:amino acid ABC transporter permease [Alphaproteobacteria bacterium]